MTSRELVKAAIGHRQTERVPYNIQLTGEMCQKITAALGVTDCNAWLNNDVQDVGIPWWGWFNLAPDWAGPATPTTPAHGIGLGNFEAILDKMKAVRDSTDKYLLVSIYASHFEKAYFARGFENFLADMAADYDFAKKLCQTIVRRNLVMLELCLHADFDGVLLGSDWGSQRGPLMSPDMWDDMIRPGEQAEYDLIHSYGKDVWVHSCGKIDPLIPRLVEMGLDVLNPLQPECMDVAQVKAKYGSKLAFWGGISTQQTLPYGTPAEVKAEARAVRDMLSEGGGYIFAAGQSLQDDLPVENLLAFLEAAREPRGTK
jgi:uroporphyrinogen decarboxylase